MALRHLVRDKASGDWPRAGPQQAKAQPDPPGPPSLANRLAKSRPRIGKKNMTAKTARAIRAEAVGPRIHGSGASASVSVTFAQPGLDKGGPLCVRPSPASAAEISAPNTSPVLADLPRRAETVKSARCPQPTSSNPLRRLQPPEQISNKSLTACTPPLDKSLQARPSAGRRSCSNIPSAGRIGCRAHHQRSSIILDPQLGRCYARCGISIRTGWRSWCSLAGSPSRLSRARDCSGTLIAAAQG